MQPRFESVADQPTLLCPSCGFTYMHHFKVEIFDRAEDAAAGLRVTVAAGQVVTGTDLTGNPSTRRDGVSISFRCESCDNVARLDVIQHKGNTHVEMLSLGGARPVDER